MIWQMLMEEVVQMPVFWGTTDGEVSLICGLGGSHTEKQAKQENT